MLDLEIYHMNYIPLHFDLNSRLSYGFVVIHSLSSFSNANNKTKNI